MRILAIVLLVNLWIDCAGQETSLRVICTEYQDYVLTHELVPAGPVLTGIDPNGVYSFI